MLFYSCVSSFLFGRPFIDAQEERLDREGADLDRIYWLSALPHHRLLDLYALADVVMGIPLSGFVIILYTHTSGAGANVCTSERLSLESLFLSFFGALSFTERPRDCTNGPRCALSLSDFGLFPRWRLHHDP